MRFKTDDIAMMRARARSLRLKPTGAEARLRRIIRVHKLGRIRRQLVVGRLIIDVAFPSRNLLIEVDGGAHLTSTCRDRRRTAWLRCLGFNVIRIQNDNIFQNAEGLIETIKGFPESDENWIRFRDARAAGKRASYLDESHTEAEPLAPPNGGPRASVSSPAVPGGPPSVS